MRRIPHMMLVLLVLITFVGSVPTAFAADVTNGERTILRSESAVNGWTVTLEDQTVLFVEDRPETGGRAPHGGLIFNFHDQQWVVVAYSGYATFTQGGVTYYGYRS